MSQRDRAYKGIDTTILESTSLPLDNLSIIPNKSNPILIVRVTPII